MIINSTKEILAFKVLNRDIDKTWIDWAVEMIQAGNETEHLFVLANEDPLNNQFILQELAKKALDELKLDYSNKVEIIKNYTAYLIEKYLNDESQAITVLEILKNICIELDYEKYLYDFYLLYFAKTDLIESENQWYILEANRSNIDQIIKEKLTNWIIDYKNNNNAA